PNTLGRLYARAFDGQRSDHVLSFGQPRDGSRRGVGPIDAHSIDRDAKRLRKPRSERAATPWSFAHGTSVEMSSVISVGSRHRTREMPKGMPIPHAMRPIRRMLVQGTSLATWARYLARREIVPAVASAK